MPRRRRRRSWILPTAVLLLLLLAAGVAIHVRTRQAREWVRAYVERSLAQELGLPVELGRVSIWLSLGSVDLRQLALKDPATGAALLYVDRIRISLALWALLGGDLRVESVHVRAPRVELEDTPAFRALAAGVAGRLRELSRDPQTPGVPVRLEEGALRYRDPATGLGVEARGVIARLDWPSPERAVAELTADPIVVRLGDRELQGLRVEGRARLAADVVEVERVRVDRGRSTIALAGMVLTGGGAPRAELTATGELALDEMASALGAGAGWSGRLGVGGKLFGEGLPRTFEGHLNLADGSLGGMPARLVTATVVLRPDRWEAISLSAQAGGGSLQAAGVFEPGAARWRATTHLTDLNLAETLGLLGQPPRLAGRVSGAVEASGQGKDPARLALRVDLRGRELRPPEGDRRAEGTLVGSAREGLLRVERLTLGRGGSELALRGTVDLRSDALALLASATVADLAGDLWPREIKGLGGRLSLSGRIGGTRQAPLFAGKVSLKSPTFGDWHADLVEGPLEAGLARVASEGLRLTAGKTVATLAGEAQLAGPEREWGRWREALRLDVKADLRGRIEELAAWSQRDWPLSGPLVLDARIRGTPTRLQGGGQVEMRELRIGGERFEAVRASLAFAGSELTVPRLTARRGGVVLQAEGAIDMDGRYRFALAPIRLDLASLPALAPYGARGSAVLKATGAGQWPEVRLEGEATLTGAVLREFQAGNGRLGFTLDGREWKWDATLAMGLRARGAVPLSLAGPVQADVTAANMDLAPLLAGVRAGLPYPLTARADGRARLAGTLPALRDLSGRIELTAARGQAGEISWQTRQPSRLLWEGGTLRLESLDLAGPGLALGITGIVRPGERTDLELAGHAPFPLLRPWVPMVADLRGLPEFRVALAGSAGDLRASGRAELSRVDVKLKAVPFWLSVASGDVRFDPDRVQYTVREGAAAGGRLEGEGSSERLGERWRHAAEFRLDKARVETLLDQIHSDRRWATGDLVARGSFVFETAPGQAPMPTLDGRLSVSLESGTLSRYPALVRIFGLLGSPTQPFRLPDLTREQMPYRQLSADFAVKGGIMETQNLLLDSEVVRVGGMGTVRLADQTVDLDLAARPLQVLEQGIRRIPLLGRLLPQEQSLVVAYFDMTGPWADPRISLAPVRSLGETVVDILLLLLKAPGRAITPAPDAR